MKNTKMPTIRFKGFNDDWEQRKVSEMFKVTRGYVLPATDTSQEMTDEMPYPVYSSQTKDNGLMGYYSDYLYEDAITWTTDGANAGTVNFRDGKFYCTNVCGVLLSDKIETSKVIAEALNNVAKRYVSYVGNPKLMNNVMADIRIAVPISKRERDQISSYFSYLDHLITLHQRKLEKIKLMKKSMLGKMFSRDAESIPKIRFDGYTDDWEQRKLSDIYGSIGNAFVGTATPYYAEQGHFYLESNNVKDGQINHNSEIFINDEFYEKQKDKWLHTGDMVMVQSGHVGHAAVIPEELDNTAAHALIMFRNPKEEIEPYFLNYEYQTDKAKKKIDNITTGNTIKHILASDMQEFVVDVPKSEEQKVIAGYFCNIDHLITLHQRKLEKLKKVKKSLLEHMFPTEK